MLITVQVSDPDHKVDTLVATHGDPDTLGFDLYDNGTKGDVKAKDGVWSYALVVSAHGATERHSIVITAYDATGKPVMIEKAGARPIPLTATTSFTIASGSGDM